MKKNIGFLIFLLVMLTQLNASAQGEMFDCDSTINGNIKLRNGETSPSAVLQKTQLKEDSAFQVYILCNQSRTEYLLLYKYPGDSKDVFSRFDIGSVKLADFDTRSAMQLTYDHFETETGIALGLNKDSVVLLKGKQYKLGNEEGMLTLTYRLVDFQSKFLRRYNMPAYTETFFFANDKLVKFWFGFDYE